MVAGSEFKPNNSAHKAGERDGFLRRMHLVVAVQPRHPIFVTQRQRLDGPCVERVMV